MIFISFAMELSRVYDLVKFHWKLYWSNTEDEEKEAWAPGELSYASRVRDDMVIVMIVYCYMVFNIWTIPVGVLYFGLGWLVTRDQVLNVYVPSNESNGKMWSHIHNRVLVAIFINQMMMCIYILLHNRYYALFMLPLGISMMQYTRRSGNLTQMPVDIALREFGEVPNVEAFYRAYIPDCLRPLNPDDVDHFEDAQPQFDRTIAREDDRD